MRIEQGAFPRIELLARAAGVHPLEQQVHGVLLPLQTRVGLLQLFQQLHNQLLQHRRIVGQQGGIGHERGTSGLMPLLKHLTRDEKGSSAAIASFFPPAVTLDR